MRWAHTTLKRFANLPFAARLRSAAAQFPCPTDSGVRLLMLALRASAARWLSHAYEPEKRLQAAPSLGRSAGLATGMHA